LFANQKGQEPRAFCFCELKAREALLLLPLHGTYVSKFGGAPSDLAITFQ
jgi:hypothetical protein